MAITKIHPIKTTLNLSIDYICDPSKTDEEILISTNGCGYKTAAIEFQKTKESTNSTCKNLARHLIQSFMPGEVSPETAHQIGKDLCEKHLQGRHEFVLTTHVDKGHIHNHIIFNNVSFIDGKSYISNKRSYHNVRKISDDLCRQNGLSIANEIANSHLINKTKGTSYTEYQERKKGNSYKAKLQYKIDASIRKAQDWEDFLRLLKNDGYEIKYGTHISFRAVDQERFTRSKTIGEDYTEERIKERIESKVLSRRNIQTITRQSQSNVVDITSNNLANESTGFARWLKLQNLKNMSKSWSAITEITDINSFYEHVQTVHDELNQLHSHIKSVESEVHNIQSIIINIDTYTSYNEIYSIYLTINDKERYFRTYEREIILYEAARHNIGQSISNELFTSVSELKLHENKLKAKLRCLHTKLNTAKENIYEINLLSSNLQTYLQSVNKPLPHHSTDHHV